MSDKHRDTAGGEVNAHIKEFLGYFLNHNKDPNYALMISGAWGIGKTFLMKRYLRSHLAGKDKVLLSNERFHYVSLNGLSTFDEIDTAVVEALFPPAQSKELKLFAKFARAGLESKLKTKAPDIKAKEILFKQGKKIFVFDDLERAGMKVSKVLGYINQFVEHDDCHIIVLAFEEEIRKQDDDYDRVKEKVIGKTLRISPSVSEALAEYIDRLNFEELQDFLTGNSELLQQIYQASGTDNLRILFQTISDFDRFYHAVRKEFRTPDAMTHVLGILAALSFELRSGGLTAADLKGRTESFVLGRIGRNKDADSPFLRACSKYAGVELTSSVLSDEVLDALLVHGRVDAKSINASLAQSGFFVGSEEEAWRTLWYSTQRSDAQCNSALLTFRREFEQRTVLEPDLIMHMFGIKLHLAEAGIDGKNRTEVTRQCEAYLDDIYNSGKILAYPPGEQMIDDVNSRGLEFTDRESNEYQLLLGKLQTLSYQAYEDRMPTKGVELLDEMETDADLFHRRVLPTGGRDRRYDDEPIFATINAEEFVDRFLKLEPKKQQSVASALRMRRQSGRSNGVSAKERPWLEKVVDLLKTRAVALPAFSRDRVMRFAKYYLANDGDEEV